MSLPAWRYPRTMAHRGAGKLAPENTLAALRHGHALGYRAAEVDVKLSADGVAFLLHDDTLERTTTGRGRANALDWRALSQLDAGCWYGPAFAGEPLPTYAAVLAWCAANGVTLNAEVKPVKGFERATGAAVALDTRAHWPQERTPPLLSSFSTDALVGARDAVPDLPRAHLFQHPLPEDWLARCQSVGAVALDCNWRSVTPELVRMARAAGLHVLCYTCNEPNRVAELLDWGVATVITDALDCVPFIPQEASCP
jgi:glycerophosphoryl diester phosphodiesterase